MGRYFMCIDNGLTTTKAVIFSDQGSEVATGIVDTRIENKGDWAELDMELLWKNTVVAIKAALAKAGIAPSEIRGVGNSGHGGGVYLLDRHGAPVRKAISSMDGRASQVLEEWQQNGISNYAQTYQNMWLGQPIPLLSWLKQNEPENYDRTGTILMAKDWIRYRLTGKLNLEYTDASNSGLINLETKGYDPQIFSPYDLEEIGEKLPPLVKSMAVTGLVTREAALETGLQENTPVIGGLFDVVACAVGSGIYDNQQYSITAGTWNINAGVDEKITPSPDIMEWVLYADDERYMCIDSSATSAVNLEWFIKNILTSFGRGVSLDETIYHQIEQRIARFGPEEVQILYLPFIYKSKLTKSMEGGFFGIKASHQIEHLLRAVYEGVVFAHLKHIDHLRKGGIVKQKASLAGGAAKSQFWCQLFADVLNIEISTTKASQVGALGIAIAVAVATGVYHSLEDAVAEMVKVERRYFPSEDRRAYQQKYQRFNQLIDLYDLHIGKY